MCKFQKLNTFLGNVTGPFELAQGRIGFLTISLFLGTFDEVAPGFR
jgi:hypothetical protein